VVSGSGYSSPRVIEIFLDGRFLLLPHKFKVRLPWAKARKRPERVAWTSTTGSQSESSASVSQNFID
jgi:hypothetical protein